MKRLAAWAAVAVALGLIASSGCGLKRELAEYCAAPTSGGACTCKAEVCCINPGFKCNPGQNCCGASTCVDDRCSGATDAGTGDGGVGGGGGTGPDGGTDGGDAYLNDAGLYRREDGGLIDCTADFPRPTTLGNCCSVPSGGACTLFGGGSCQIPGTAGPGPCCVDVCDGGSLCSCLVSGTCTGSGQLTAVNPAYLCPTGVPGW